MSSKVVVADEEQDKLEPGVLSWIGELRRVSMAVSKKSGKPSGSRNQIFYVLHWTADARGFGITVHRGRERENAEEWWSIDRSLVKPPPFATDDDVAILGFLWAERSYDSGLRAFGLGPMHGAECVARMVRTVRLYAASDFSPLVEADPRSGRIDWRVDANGLQRPALVAIPDATLVLPLDPPWFIDLSEGTIGQLRIELSSDVLKQLVSLPPLAAEDVRKVADSLKKATSALPVPAADACARLRRIDAAPVAVLRLQTIVTHGNRSWRDYPQSYAGGEFDVALPVFRYQDAEVKHDERREFCLLPDGETVRVERRIEVESRLMQSLFGEGLQAIPTSVLHTFGCPPDNALGLANESSWGGFMQDALPRLQAAGWQVEFDDDFRHYMLEVDAWDAELIEADNGWFDLDMGIIVEGERLPLAPLLASLFRRDSRWLDLALLRQISDDETIELRTPSNKRIRVLAGRLKPLAATLIDLFDGFSDGRTLRLSRFDAPRLAELNDRSRWQFRGQGDVFALADQLVAAQGISQVEAPAALGLELRSYQREGLAWLQFLRAQNLSGILADDMGLGKTAQALAHLLVEKESGRLDRPALIVLPTSLIFNWKNEAARFAPSLTVLSLHGAERKMRFAEIPSHDVVLTTYPLLWRDAHELMKHAYHLLILDEAQTVKNARSQGAEVVRKLEARHRLCLTGTPLENHLGELWSQFDFLLPGFLGDSNTFAKYWRTPIEKQGDLPRRDLLARRIRPFILRRKKEEVARELPPKTIIR